MREAADPSYFSSVSLMPDAYLQSKPELEDYWRGIILFGRNVASYKFALANALLDIKPQSGQLLKLADLAPVYASKLVQHLKVSPKQITSRSSNYLDACRLHGIDAPDQNKLIDETVKSGFNNVIDAFHVVGQDQLPTRFYIDERKTNKGIRITDEFSALLDRVKNGNLSVEVESRWNLVETAWGLGIKPTLINIEHDLKNQTLFTFDQSCRRKSVTSARGALNGYQKGKCFYCRCSIDIDNGLTTEVDHFFPHALSRDPTFAMINGIWNLVLACDICNAGVGGKHARIPTLNMLERLEKRNNYLISSHHPLRETLINQTGKTESIRREFLNTYHNRALSSLFHTWEPQQNDADDF